MILILVIILNLNFNPIDTKRQQINKIKQLITHSKEVVLATDDDREGEAISWHICQAI